MQSGAAVHAGTYQSDQVVRCAHLGVQTAARFARRLSHRLEMNIPASEFESIHGRCECGAVRYRVDAPAQELLTATMLGAGGCTERCLQRTRTLRAVP